MLEDITKDSEIIASVRHMISEIKKGIPANIDDKTILSVIEEGELQAWIGGWFAAKGLPQPNLEDLYYKLTH